MTLMIAMSPLSRIWDSLSVMWLSTYLSTNSYLHLDNGIRDWVVIPMLILMLLVGIGRQFVQQLIKTETTVTEKDLNGDFRLKQV